jgi:hypothetical protein
MRTRILVTTTLPATLRRSHIQHIYACCRYYVYEASFTEVDQPEDVIWRNFGVSLFEVRVCCTRSIVMPLVVRRMC